MSPPATGPPEEPPPPAPGPGRPASEGPSPAGRRRWRTAILVAVLGVCVGVTLVALALRPSEPASYGPELAASVEAACRRSAPDVDDPTAACRCAYRRLAATVPFERLRELDDELRRRGRPAPELAAAVEGCRVDQR